MTMERREDDRKLILADIKVINLKTNETIGHVGNFAGDGFMLISPEEIGTRDFYRVQLRLPRRIVGKDKLEFNARCRWCRKLADFIYNSGFEFISPLAEDVQLIEYWFHDKETGR